jgi:hypothetical protein
LSQGQDLGILRDLDLLEPGLEGGGLGVAAGSEDVGGEEQADDLVQAGLGGRIGDGFAGGQERLMM